jgi:hypothetical protein
VLQQQPGRVRVQIPEMLQCTPDLNSHRVDATPQKCGPLPGVYGGFCLRGKPDGRGEWIGDEGHSYTGEWQAGRQDGKGKEVNSEGYTFKGDFRNGKAHLVQLLPNRRLGYPHEVYSLPHWDRTGLGQRGEWFGRWGLPKFLR